MRLLFFLTWMILTPWLPAQPLFMSISIPEIDGNKVSYDIHVSNFEDIYIMGTSFSFDTNRMTFLAAKNIAIPTLGESEFLNEEPGYVYFTWFDLTMEGVSLPENTIIYTLQFKMKDGDPGDVCFSNYPTELLFTDFDSTFHSLFVTDYCHPDTFEYILVTQTSDILDQMAGLSISSFSNDNEIYFKLESSKTISFELLNTNGQVVQTFSTLYYSFGNNYIQLRSSITPGLYFLKCIINQKPFVKKVVVQ
jgi:hypothetical protein